MKKHSEDFVADISVGSNFYSLLPRLPNTHYGALAEFIDNSISSFIKNRNLPEGHKDKYDASRVIVELKFDKTAEIITIKDNASGISKEDLPRALKPLEAPDTFQDTLNEHGYGMKGAAGWYAKKFTINTSVYGDPFSRTITYEFDKIVNQKLTQIPVEVVDAPLEDHGTTIKLEKFNDKRFPSTNSLKSIKLHLSDIYRTFIRKNILDMKFNDEHILPMEVKVQTTSYYAAAEDPNAWKIKWKKDFKFDNLGKNKKGIERSISGYGALRQDGSHGIHSGMAIFNNGRILKGSARDTNKPKALFGSGNTFRSLRLTGEIHLHNFDTTASKDDLIWGDLEEEDLYKMIRESLSGNKEVFLELYNKKSVKESELNSSMPLMDQIEHLRVNKKPKKDLPKLKKPLLSVTPTPIQIKKDNVDDEKDINEVLKNAQTEIKNLNISNDTPDLPTKADEPFDHEAFNTQIEAEKPWKICISGKDYEVQFKNETVTEDQLYSVISDNEETITKIIIYINSNHEFVQNFLGPIQKEPVSIFLRMIVSLVLTEMTLPMLYNKNEVPIATFRLYFNDYISNYLSMIDIN